MKTALRQVVQKVFGLGDKDIFPCFLRRCHSSGSSSVGFRLPGRCPMPCACRKQTGRWHWMRCRRAGRRVLCCVPLPPGTGCPAWCRATIGEIGNLDHENLTLGKAGRSRWLGVRPANRGVAMNPNDHPHGGGEGHSPVGRKRPVTPWGKSAFGTRTRKNKKASSKLILKRRTK